MNDQEKIVGEEPVQSQSKWGEIPADNFGYSSDEERREKRGLEDWELVEKIPESQGRVPPWFFAIIGAVLLVSIGLSYPFWGARAGFKLDWEQWGIGTGAAIAYLLVFGAFVYYMVNYYGTKVDGPMEAEKDNTANQHTVTDDAQKDDTNQK